jgi:hypothetical protein
MEKMPERNVPFDRIMLPVIEAYYTRPGDTASANRSTNGCSTSWMRTWPGT